MAISTYAELQTAVANWLDRNDLTARIPEFIALAEADINSQFDLRTIESDQALTAVVGARFIPLPATFREPQNLWINWTYGRGDPLRFVTPELINVTTVAGCPHVWCIDGGNIAFNCPADKAYSLTLRQIGGVELSDATPTNLILTNYPNVYLYGALKASAPYLRDPDALAVWAQFYAEALELAKAKENRAKSLVTLSTEPGMLTFYGNRRGFNVNRGW